MFRDLIPAPARKIVYAVLGAAWGVEAIFDFVPEGVEGRIAAALAVLGFTMAASNTPRKAPADG